MCASLPIASTQDPKDLCDLPNCTRPKAVEANGYKYNYCCRDHALKDGESGTVAVYVFIHLYLECMQQAGLYTRGGLHRVYTNPLPGSVVYTIVYTTDPGLPFYSNLRA